MRDYDYLWMWLVVGMGIQAVFFILKIVEWKANLMTFVLTPVLGIMANHYVTNRIHKLDSKEVE